MKKSIIAAILLYAITMMMLCVCVNAETDFFNQRYDPINKQIIINSRFDTGPEHDVYFTVTDNDGEIKYRDAVKTVANGEYTANFGVGDFSVGKYCVNSECESIKKEFTFELPFQTTDVTPILLQSNNPYILTDGKNIDSIFYYVELTSNNAEFIDRKYVLDKDYTVTGLPDGISVEVVGFNSKTIQCIFSGNMENTQENDCHVSFVLNSTAIAGGSANTNSKPFLITLCSDEYSKRVNIAGDYSISFEMRNEIQVNENTNISILNIGVRNLRVNGLLDKTYYSLSGLPKGLNLTVYADEKNNALQVSLIGSALNKITKDVLIEDFKLSSNICEGSSSDSLPIKISIKAVKSELSQGGTSSGTSSGGGGGASTSASGSYLDVESVFPDPPKKTFADITGHWARDDIENLLSLGYVNGFSTNSFCPDNCITRAEFIAIVVRIAGFTLAEYKDSFLDVTADKWYSKYVQTSLENNIISGGDNFRPEDYITRQEMTKLLILVYQSKKQMPTINVDIKSFVDYENISDWAIDYVVNAASLGIIGGYPDGTFRPLGNATRAEASTVLYKLYNILK